MKRFMATAAVWGIGSAASAMGMLGTAGVMANTAAMGAESSSAPAPGACITNFSKDGCEGYVKPGSYETFGCEGTDCKTIRVRDAAYVTNMKSSGLLCSAGSCLGRCDEFPDGQMTLKFSYMVRADSCCPFRGSWSGEWEYVADDGRIFTGKAHGTIGVGTNRESQCDIVGDACERCYDVQTSDSQWLIGIEGSYRGYQVNGSSDMADELNFTMDGTWIVKRDGSQPFSEPFKVYNRFDGAVVDYCP